MKTVWPISKSLQTAVLLTMMLAWSLILTTPARAANQEGETRAVSQDAYLNCTYLVRPGDDLYRIGLKYNVSWWYLAIINGLPNPHMIFAGMVLRVPCSYPPPPPPAPPVCSTHIVQRGEWLGLIAAHYGISWQAIASLNQLPNPNLIFPGQRLLIPCAASKPTPPPPAVVTGVSVTLGSTSPYTGTCPANVVFSGIITTTAPITVRYQWERSDGIVNGPYSVTSVTTSSTITDQWLSAPLGTTWERIHILSPNDLASNQAFFTNNCH